MTKTRIDASHALMSALMGTALAVALVGLALVARDEGSGTLTALLVAAIVLLAIVQGVLIAGLRSEAERVKRTVEGR
jgi:xanthine/uracil/vitamin C permease (AzgA family)